MSLFKKWFARKKVEPQTVAQAIEIFTESFTAIKERETNKATAIALKVKLLTDDLEASQSEVAEAQRIIDKFK